jgi:hypothetical protein
MLMWLVGGILAVVAGVMVAAAYIAIEQLGVLVLDLICPGKRR